MNDNKRIAINTLAIYFKLIVTTIVSLITARYVLLSLGQSDYGLYNVVGAVIVLMNTIGTAMYTTTRRFINVEMGKGEMGNPNRIFNISLVLHISFAIVFFVIAETIGLWYINKYLQVDAGKISDANFVFQVSTIVACIGLINVPYQGLMNAFQKFWEISFIEITITILKLLLVLVLIRYNGNALRFYALSMSFLTFCSFVLYHVICRHHWREIVKFKFYRERGIYREVLVFNNYTAIGAASSLGRTQGSAMLINFFFGTMVNGALAIAYQIQSFTSMFAGNIVQAAAPQITQAYSSDNKDKAFNLCSSVARMTIIIMICVFFPLITGLDAILEIWLQKVPDGACLLTKWVLVASLINSFLSTLYIYIQATGKVKWFQITGSILELLVLPISFYLFHLGYQPVTIFMVLSISTSINIVLFLLLLYHIDNFNSLKFIQESFVRPIIIILLLCLSLYFLDIFFPCQINWRLLLVLVEFIISLVVSFIIGFNRTEKNLVLQYVFNKIKNRKL